MKVKGKIETKWERGREVRTVRKMMFFSWAFSIVIPIILIIVINLMTYGSNAVNFLMKPDFFNKQVYQLNELNSGEYLRKELNNFTIDQPSAAEVIVKIEDMADDYANIETDKRFDKVFVIVRKNNDLLITRSFGEELTDEDREKFARLPEDILPVFKPGRETKNELLFHETGYVIAAQQDFYFADGSEGSIFAFHKYTNIPGKIASTIGRNILYVFFMMFFFHMVMGYFMTKRVTKPVQAIVNATEEVSLGNYNYQIPIGNQPFLGSISESINSMIIELDKGKKVQNKIDSIRSEFIANVSHDMKTPLTSIKIHAQAIKDGIVQTPEKMERYLDNILTKSNDMDTMLDELKLFNELELGTGNYIMQPINFKHFLEDAVEELQYDVASEHISLNLEMHVEDPILEFDPKKMKRVLNNITFNAVKYAETRPLRIDFTLVEIVREGNLCLELRIQDNGVGVADEEYDKLFKQHYRVDPSRNQTISGSGLGLSIAESIINHHGGCIHAEKSFLGGLAIVINLNCEVS